MSQVYHKIVRGTGVGWVERVVRNALEMRLRRLIFAPPVIPSGIVLRTRQSTKDFCIFFFSFAGFL
jgi:hypothetical protein